MLAIRLQRTGRKGHAQFRMVVQDSRRTPTSGRFVYLLGSYNPHSKTIQIDKEKAEFYLKNGARPSERVAHLLQQEGVKLPAWVEPADKKEGKLRNPDKLRRNRPPEEVKAEEPKAEEPAAEAETPAETTEATEPAEAAPAEEAPAQAPAVEETPAEPVAEAEAEAAPEVSDEPEAPAAAEPEVEDQPATDQDQGKDQE